MVSGQKMEGFGSADLQRNEPKAYVDIHNKPNPKSLWHAVSRLASTTWDVAKPTEGKVGHTKGDIGKTAADVFLTFSGNCKFTGSLMPLEERMRCPCAGCQSWDNEKCLKEQQEETALEDKLREKREQDLKEEQEKEQRRKAGLPPVAAAGVYVPPSMSAPPVETKKVQQHRTCRTTPEASRAVTSSEPGGSAFAFVNADAVPVEPTVAAPTDLPPVATADLLGGAFDDEQSVQQSQDLTALLMSHAAAPSAETDLLGFEAAAAPVETDLLGFGATEVSSTTPAEDSSSQWAVENGLC